MDCNLVRDQLLAYHLGASERAEDVDAHLLGCRACLSEFLSVKRQIEVGARGERPSAKVRDQLRARVAQEFRPSWTHGIRAWLARPMPRYQSAIIMAAAAVVIVVLKSGPAPLQKTKADEAQRTLLTDSASNVPESLEYY